MDTQPYIVEQGDYLLKLAARHGFDAKAVWQHSSNKHLIEQGRDPNILLPGDVIYVPKPKREWLPVKLGQSNRFSAKPILAWVRVQFQVLGKPLAKEPYTVEGADVEPGTLDGDGVFAAKVTTTTREFIVTLTGREERYLIRVGHLDPVTEESGVWSRLGSLGFHGHGVDAACNSDELRESIRRFQTAHSLDVTGAMNSATRRTLQEKFGR